MIGVHCAATNVHNIQHFINALKYTCKELEYTPKMDSGIQLNTVITVLQDTYM